MTTFNDLFNSIAAVLTGNGSVFQPLGLMIFRLITVLMLMLFGAKTLLLGYWNMREFLRLLVTILLVLLALTYYATPAPMYGISFTHLVTDEAKYLSGQLVLLSESESTTFSTITAILRSLDSSLPLIPSALQLFRYVALVSVLSMFEAFLWAIIAWGFIATAILTILGPLFLPWAIFPGMEWLTWSWFKSFLAYAFYQVVAGAYMLIAGHYVSLVFGANPGPYTTASAWALLLPVVMMGFALGYGALQIPHLVRSLFFGGTGEAAVPRFLR